MYTKSPDYIICDCGCPHYSSNTNSFYNNNNCNSEFCYAEKRKISPFMLKPNESIENNVKLLPLRETLTEYYQRLLIERAGLLRGSGRDDETAELKQYKNQRNEAVKQRQQQQQQRRQLQRQQQQPRNSWRNQPHEGGNQNSTDKTFSRRAANKQVTTLTTTKTTTTTTTTHADSDCDDVF